MILISPWQLPLHPQASDRSSAVHQLRCLGILKPDIHTCNVPGWYGTWRSHGRSHDDLDPDRSKDTAYRLPRAKKVSWKERFQALYTSLPALGGPAILVLGIMTGIFTPTECSVVAAMYV